MPLLEVGDIVYGDDRYDYLSKYKIERVTDTLAISGNLKFYREYSEGGQVKCWGKQNGWHFTAYGIETEELKLRYERQRLLALIRHHKFQLNTTEQLREIKRIIKETPEEKTK